MLTVKDVSKIYKTKGGVEVKALDGVSIEFEQKGMVFLLGRSGSGKSTLLNVAGGLDKPTSGEIILNGKSSKDFTSADFDSYRNTYVGFIFQEYNILEEFTVEQNILLALQLQNKSSDKNAVNQLLEQVDLHGVNKRKPKTLSGGQRQRVAIARALIKNPKIIFADEPTGALDSGTGEQIFETLKKLSKDRLVIVVSHDRGFAEKYGDRIIELADGKVISDVTKEFFNVVTQSKNVTINDDTIVVKDWEKITEKEVSELVVAMKKMKKETVITSNANEIDKIKRACGVEENSQNNFSFVKTKKKEKGEQVVEQANFIKSRLPFRHALKLALDGIKTKPIRLAFTVLLAVIAFTFFGVSSVLMMYNPQYSVADAISKSDYESIVLNKEYVAYFEQTNIRDNNTEYVTEKRNVTLRTAFTQQEIDRMNQNSLGLKFAGIIDLGKYNNDLESINGYDSRRYPLSNIVVEYDYQRYYCAETICGFSDCGQEFLNDNGFELLAGRYPENYTEIAIPEYIYEVYAHSRNTNNLNDNVKYNSPSDIIGKTIKINAIDFTVVGVYDVGDIPPIYDELLNVETKMDLYSIGVMVTELKDILENSFHTVVFVSPDFYDEHKFDNVVVDVRTVYGLRFNDEPISSKIREDETESVLTPKSIWENDQLVKFYNVDGNVIDYPKFEEKDAYISSQVLLVTIRDFLYDFMSGAYLQYQTDPDYVLLKDIISNYVNSRNLTLKENEIFIDNIFSLYQKLTGEKIVIQDKVYSKNLRDETDELTVKGVFTYIAGNNYNNYGYAVSDEFCDKYGIENARNGTVINDYFSEYKVDPKTEKYGYIICATNRSMAQTYYMLSGGKDGATYVMTNFVYETTMATASIIYEMKVLFYISAIVFGLFASLMLFNFISVSISSKNKEIGVLRAVGARKTDVFKIFLTEALVITLTCFVVSAVFSGFACSLINSYTATSGVKISLLNYKVINVAMLFVIVIIVSALATFMPVSRAARKSPVDSIRTI